MDPKKDVLLEEECRRSGQDRRNKPTPFLSKYVFSGTRRDQRREQDRRGGYYVDRPNREMVRLVAAVGMLCVLDALLTLYHIGMGAVEINPVVNYYLTMGNGYFFLFKVLVTLPGLIILLLHQNFQHIKKVISYIGGLYSVVVIYHLLLFILIPA